MTTYNIISELEKSSSKFPTKVAIYGVRKNYCYYQFSKITDYISNYLTEIVGSGENIGLVLDQGENIVFSFFSILKSNNIYVPFSPNIEYKKLKDSLISLNINVIITDDKNFNQVR
ncbi:TPA: AMP-binding protein, partial [Streptococcus suis]